MRRIAVFSSSVFVLLLLVFAASAAQAQITDQIEANVHHSFILGNTTLPPGRYIFRMLSDSNLEFMRATSADGRTSTEFLVRESEDSHTPRHSELIFNRYGSKEFLARIYQVGTKDGVAVADVSREEGRLQKKGQKAAEHTEEQVK